MKAAALIKKYMDIAEIKKIGIIYNYGSYCLQSTKNKVYKDEKGYFIKVKGGAK